MSAKLCLLVNGAVMAVLLGVGTVADPQHAAGIVAAFLWLLPTVMSLYLVD